MYEKYWVHLDNSANGKYFMPKRKFDELRVSTFLKEVSIVSETHNT